MKVKVMTWEEMVKEFGLDFEGDIDAPIPYTKIMETLMPENREVELTGEDNDYWNKEGYYIDSDAWSLVGSD